MSIVTKTGDKGKTSLYCGKKVWKDDLRIETCGALDEVSSFLGMAKSLIKDKAFKSMIGSIQKDLFLIGTEVVTSVSLMTKVKRRICDKEVRCLEESIEELESDGRLKFRSFCVPGENTLSGALHVARAITRRTERRSAALLKKKMLTNRSVLIYLNRLSDLLYLLARAHEKEGRVK